MQMTTYRQRLLADPFDRGPDMLEAIESDPALRKFRDEVIQFELKLSVALNDVSIPEFSVLMAGRQRPASARRYAIIDWFRSISVSLPRFAVTAVVLLTLSVTGFRAWEYQSRLNLESRFVESLVQHIYHDTATLAPAAIETFSTVSRAFSQAGGEWLLPDTVRQLQIGYAVPCKIFPNIDSVHLLVKDSAGYVNVVLIRNSPVSREFAVGDDRFAGTAFAEGSSAIVVLGERSARRSPEQLQRLKNSVADSMQWNSLLADGNAI